MASGDKFVNIVNKRLMGKESFKDYFLDYMKTGLVEPFFARVYDRDGAYGSAVGISSSGNDEIDLAISPDRLGTDGSGHLIKWGASDGNYFEAISFENQATNIYDVGVHYAERPSGVHPNPRTGKPEYMQWQETWGVSDDPVSISDQGGGGVYRFRLPTSMCPGDRTYAGRKCLLWKKVPGDDALSEEEAILELDVAFNTYNFVDVNTGTYDMGQATFSVVAADYTVLLLGPTIARNTDVDLQLASDYWFIGKVTGNGPAATPTVFDITQQNLIVFSLSDALDYDQKIKALVYGNAWEHDLSSYGAIEWWDFAPIHYLADQFVNSGLGLVLVGEHDEYLYTEGGAVWTNQSITGATAAVKCYGAEAKIGTVPPNIALMIVGEDAGSPFIYSEDSPGLAPNARTPAGSYSGVFRQVATDGSRWVAVGTGGEIQYSDNMQTFTQATSGTSQDLYHVHYENGLWVVGGANGVILTSTDGATWVVRTAGSSYANMFRGGCYHAGIHYLVGYLGEIQKSENAGVTWVRVIQATPVFGGNLQFEKIKRDTYNDLFAISGAGPTDPLVIRTYDFVSFDRLFPREKSQSHLRMNALTCTIMGAYFAGDLSMCYQTLQLK